MYFSEEQISRKLFKTKMLIITIRFFYIVFYIKPLKTDDFIINNYSMHSKQCWVA